MTFPTGATGIGGGEIILTVPTTPAVFTAGVKPGQWLMLAGLTTGTPAYGYARWYRVAAADTVASGTQYVTLAGPDWNSQGLTAPNGTTQAWLFDGVIAVYEKNMRLEIP